MNDLKRLTQPNETFDLLVSLNTEPSSISSDV